VDREVLAQADRLGSDLIVIGTHGRSGFQRLFLGSTAEKVLRKARCPVMTVPPQAPNAMPRGPAPFTRILCAVDFSTSSSLALDYAMSLAEESGAALMLVHVIEVIPLYYDLSPPAVVDLAAWTNAALVQLREMVPAGVRSRCAVKEVVETGKPYRRVLALAAESDTDLIVMGVQGRSAADLFFFGSTTHHVVREAGCAVLTLRR
jgi:nucleotide-binding universal stress UspA family protein